MASFPTASLEMSQLCFRHCMWALGFPQGRAVGSKHALGQPLNWCQLLQWNAGEENCAKLMHREVMVTSVLLPGCTACFPVNDLCNCTENIFSPESNKCLTSCSAKLDIFFINDGNLRIFLLSPFFNLNLTDWKWSHSDYWQCIRVE